MSSHLKCVKCNYTKPIPMHCKQSMHIETIEDEGKLVCWMGPSCGVEDIPQHHGHPMIIVEEPNDNKSEKQNIQSSDIIHEEKIHSKITPDNQKQDTLLICQTCDYSEPIPMHCKQPIAY